jgi:arsenite-transporting ATPase
MGPTCLNPEQLRLLIFCGKGGVGKTTIACAVGLELARRFPDKNILLLSTDPAHSLCDSLDQPIGDHLRPVMGLANLSARELDAGVRLSAFRRRYHKELEALLDRGTPLAESEAQELLRHSLSGLDQVACLIEVARLARSAQHDLILLDTAPTGHLLRFLELPELMQGWIQAASLMQEKHRYVVGRLTRRSIKKDSVDGLLAELSADVKGIRSLLRDVRATGAVLVTIPEPMALAETARLHDRLRQLHVPMRCVVVNKVLPSGTCAACSGRAEAQACLMDDLTQRFRGLEVLDAPLFPAGVRGTARLFEVGACLLSKQPGEAPACPPTGAPRPPLRPTGRLKGLEDLELLLFGGKGGVGKTTMACATALALSQRDRKRTLIFSTDPAHSLSDCFGRDIGNRLTAISDDGRLTALEIDAVELFQELEAQFAEAVADAFDSGATELPFERAITEGFLKTTPPGIDELLALMKIVEFMREGAYDRYVLDLAPTGHALRFLESFDLVDAWRTSASALVVRYGTVANRPLAILVERLRHLRTVRELLRDPTRCQLVGVTVPETMVVSELKRLLERLQALGICTRHLIVNMVVLENGCAFCQAKRYEQQEPLQQLQTLKFNLVRVPLAASLPVGLGPLQELANRLYPPMREKKEVAAEVDSECDLAQVGVADRTESKQGSWVSRLLHLWK